ncbi:hypothetical protein Pcinc_010789 [Petrolisthes cinctipes]|uniref:Gag-like protein n=1 Tax=Petrolisthes cinctipes TaxID=88211 RepID=A0AAE1KT90_PETCI|nr:hypothetical protein Pcinc_010789 [Petrolisthes cinctipes]
MDIEKPQSLPRAMVDQALETSLSGRGSMQKDANKTRPSRSGVVSKNPVSDLDTLMLTNVLASLPYGTIHSIFKCFVVVLRMMKCSKTMIILTFYGSHIPDRININSISFEVKPFVERPLQCFCCYEFGHGRRNCNNRSRCGNCSALDSHLTSEC